ncbi:MAG: glycosyltransferase family 2 protein [Bacteroidales bacterium]|nr:glycosyltransferase family 2 protein [Bacteroidales bacterium]
MQQTTYIIIINFKTWRDTIECLSSLLELKNRNFVIRIVEMGNHNNSRQKIANWMKKHQKLDVEIIDLDNNLGFAGTNNKALEQTLKANENAFFWMLNNDTVVDPNSLDQLIESWHSIREAETYKPAFIGSKVIDYSRRDFVQTVGGTFNQRTGITSLTGFNQKATSFPETGVLQTDFVLGASMFFHCSLVDQIGLMDERFFLYYEDVDWCYRAKSAGFQNYTCLSSIVFHKQGATIGNRYDKTSFNPDTFKYLHSSYIKFVIKHFPGRLPVALFMLLKQALGKMIRGRIREAAIILKVLVGSMIKRNQN